MMDGLVQIVGRGMSYEKMISQRRKYFEGFCTKTVSDFLIHNKNFSPEEKREILSIAMKINPVRVDWETFVEALKEWRKHS
jgi:hypothetical protein